MSPLVDRRFKEEDRYALNDSYNRYTGRTRTIEQFEWEWLNTNEGWGDMWVLLDSDTGKIVGHHGLIPVSGSYFGKPILFGKTENTHLHPPYAAKGVYFPFEAKFIQEATDRFALLFTTHAVGAPARIRQKLGYAIVGQYAEYIRPTNRPSLESALNRAFRRALPAKLGTILGVLSRPTALLLWLVFHRRLNIDRDLTFQPIDDIESVTVEIDSFWVKNKGSFGITPDRQSRYLNWRIFDNPNVRYNFLLARKNGEIVGYVITKPGSDGSSDIADIVALGTDGKIFNAILHKAVVNAGQAGSGTVSFFTLRSNNSLNKSFRKNGFIDVRRLHRLMRKFARSTQQEAVFMAKAVGEVDQARVSNPASWYFTDLLMEGIR